MTAVAGPHALDRSACPVRDRRRRYRGCCAGLLVLCVAGCASTAGTGGSADDPSEANTGVGQRMIVPSTVSRYELADHQAFVFPQILANDAPAFPASYRPASPFTATVCASLVVAEDGAVRDVRLVDAPGCTAPAEAPAPLAAAVHEAMSAWKFGPAMLCEYPDAETRERAWNGDGCAGPVREARPVPVTLSWAFTFELRDGQARVTRNLGSAR